MKTVGLALAVTLLATVHVVAGDTRFERSLRNLDPSARLEQICDYTAMLRIRASTPFRPDRAVGSASSPAKAASNMLVANGAAFRSRKKWYRLSYTCKTTPDRMKVLAFDYKTGPEIPEEKWNTYGLWR
ncbi:MAG: DUF930 domain-containing protein [Rhizobiales bacterium]|nr:DUF930 domain-containing protein [Hyphomicrobiales bacterium]